MWGLQIVKKVELEAQRAAGGRGGNRRKRNPIEDLKREVAIMRKLRHKNITALQEARPPLPHGPLGMHPSCSLRALCALR